MPSLADLVPEIAAFRQSHSAAADQQMGQLQQMGALQGILANMEKQKQAQRMMQQEQERRTALAAAGTPEERLAINARYATPDAAMKTDTAHLDRQAGLKEAAAKLVQAHAFKLEEIKQRSTDAAAAARETLAEKQRFERSMKEFMVANRPPVPERPVTPVTIQDPNDPSATIVIDGRTRQVLGKGPKMTQAGAIDAKTQLSLTGLGADLQSAEDLLTGVVRTSDGQVVKGNKPTGSGVGSLYDAAAGFVGLSPAGAAEADSLKVVAARLISKVPRFEGPQSDKDVQLYKQAAGDAGNEKLPTGRRLAAIKTMRAIYSGYESGQRGRLIGNRRASDGASTPKTVNFADLPE